MRLLVLVMWSVLMAAGTRLLGWWAVLALGALASLAVAAGGEGWAPRQGRSVARGAALAAMLGWAALLAWAAIGPQFDTVTGLVGTLLRVPWPVVAVLTLLLPALLAWSASAVAEGALAHVPRREPRSAAPERPDAAGQALEPRSTPGLG